MDDFYSTAARVSNRGRWGPEDERGTLNLISPDRIIEAARLVRRGDVFDLGISVNAHGPMTGKMRSNPTHLMTYISEPVPGGSPIRWSDDLIIMGLQTSTHWDSLAHVSYDGLQYNGVAAETTSVRGAEKNSIEGIAKGVIGRGVLLDLARAQGADWLAAGYGISPDELDRTAERQSVEVKPGDILLIRTGWRRKFLSDGSAAEFFRSEPGLTMACADWLHDKEVAAVCSDNYAIEMTPSTLPELAYALHLLLIRDMGMTLGELLDLEELGRDCAADGVYEFLFCGTALKVSGGVGSPTNPVAIK